MDYAELENKIANAVKVAVAEDRNLRAKRALKLITTRTELIGEKKAGLSSEEEYQMIIQEMNLLVRELLHIL